MAAPANAGHRPQPPSRPERASWGAPGPAVLAQRWPRPSHPGATEAAADLPGAPRTQGRVWGPDRGTGRGQDRRVPRGRAASSADVCQLGGAAAWGCHGLLGSGTLNRALQPKGRMGAHIQARFFLQSHPPCGLGAPVCWEHTVGPEPLPTPHLHSPASLALPAALRPRWMRASCLGCPCRADGHCGPSHVTLIHRVPCPAPLNSDSSPEGCSVAPCFMGEGTGDLPKTGPAQKASQRKWHWRRASQAE